jgi:hypothetical protein
VVHKLIKTIRKSYGIKSTFTTSDAGAGVLLSAIYNTQLDLKSQCMARIYLLVHFAFTLLTFYGDKCSPGTIFQADNGAFMFSAAKYNRFIISW